MAAIVSLENSVTESRQEVDALTIRVSSGSGSGRTRLAAFDAALRNAGVADFNLIRLRAVIPPLSQVVEVDAQLQLRGVHGDRLYCVYAEAYATVPFQEAWAGMAWSQRGSEPRDGLIVEHSGDSQSCVEHDLRLSLADLSQRRGGGFIEGGLVMSSAVFASGPVCAIVIATYLSDSWNYRGE